LLLQISRIDAKLAADQPEVTVIEILRAVHLDD